MPKVDDLQWTDFYKPAHGALWQAITALVSEGVKPDAITVYDRAQRFGYGGQGAYLVELMANGLPVRRETVEVVIRCRVARDLIRTCQEAIKEVSDAEDPFLASERLQGNLAALGSLAPSDPQAMTFEELMEIPDEGSEWIIPDLITRDAMALIIAGEGVGKATWMRQIGMCAAQGIHPMMRWPIDPIRVLYCDFENPLRNILNPAANLQQTLLSVKRDQYESGNFKLWRKRSGLNVLRPRDRADFEREVAAFRPDLVLLGPLNRFYARLSSKQNYEDVAGDVIDILARLREKYAFGLIIEHHSPKDRSHGLFPMGSQRWMGDPDLGITMAPDKSDPNSVVIDRFRGDRFQVKWPTRLERDEEWIFRAGWD